VTALVPAEAEKRGNPMTETAMEPQNGGSPQVQPSDADLGFGMMDPREELEALAASVTVVNRRGIRPLFLG
jgi:hypothetical protein